MFKDFDGDACTIQLVPPEVAEDVYNKMSGRYMTTYKKNNKPIFPFNHETLEIALGVIKSHKLLERINIESASYII